MTSYTAAILTADVAPKVSGEYTAANFLILSNQAIREVLGDIDLRSTIRKAALSPNLFDDIYEYSAPTDLKGDCIIDIQPQVERSRNLSWDLIPPEEFDRNKQDGKNLISICNDDQVRTLLVSSEVNDVGFTIDALDAVGDWAGFGDGENLMLDTDDYVKGSGSINWDINGDGGTTAGIYNDSLDEFDITDYAGTGSIFTWAYLSDATDVTNFIVRVGSSSSNYYYVTSTTKNDGTAFEDGWQLIRFDLSGKAETGSVDEDACNYVALYMTKDSGKTSETDYRFDQIIIKKGLHAYLKYYSKYGWISNAGVRLENSTATTDILMCDSTEYDMIVAKTCAIVEQHLGNDNSSIKFEKDYQDKKANYMFRVPSQSLMLQQTYYEL